MSVKTQPFLNWDQQVTVLREQYNIEVESPKSAIYTLKKYSYETLVDGYKQAFKKDQHSEKFIPGITIETLGVLQMLENRLSSELLQALLSIEKNIKSLFQYELAKKFGVQQNNYLRIDHYNASTCAQKRHLARLFHITQQKRHISQTLEDFQQQGNIPPWVLVNEMTFGQFQRWYAASPDAIREAVANGFCNDSNQKITLPFFEQALRFFLDFRNALAHGELIGQLCAKETITQSQLQAFYPEKLLPSCKQRQTKHTESDFYILFLLFGLFLKQSEKQIFKDQVLNLLRIFDSLLPINEEPMRHLLGNIPENMIERVEQIL